MTQYHNQLIINSVLLKKAKAMGIQKFAFYGSLTIPFCTSSKIYQSEFKRLSNHILNALNQQDKSIYYILNYVPGEESINTNGDILVGYSVLNFVLGDIIDCNGKAQKKYRDDMYDLINALWPYEIEGFFRVGAEDINMEYALGIKTFADGFGVGNEVFMSADLMQHIFIEDNEEKEGGL